MKKSFFYSIAVLIVLTPLIALVVFYSMTSAQTSSSGVSKVVSREAVNFVNSIDYDFERALATSAKSAVVSSISRVISQGQPLADARLSLESLAYNGSFQDSSSVYPSMGSNYLYSWASAMQNLSLYYGLNSTISLSKSNVSVSSAGPFSLSFTADISVFAQPLSNPGAFNFSKKYSASTVVSIAGFEDPLFALNSQGLVSRPFSQNESNVVGVAALDQAVAQKRYVPNAGAPDFLNRLEGNLSASAFGIETVVNPNEFTAQDLPVHNQSHSDHLYFNSTLPDLGLRVTGSSYSWLKLDCEHSVFYGVTAQTPGC